MEALRSPKTAIKNIFLGSRGSRGGPPSPVPYFPTIRSSVFSSVGAGGRGEAFRFFRDLAAAVFRGVIHPRRVARAPL